MRFRPALAIAMTVFVYTATALLWRQVFPFRDGIAQFLPEGTITYVHVNLTAAMRREVEAQSSKFKAQIGEPIIGALTTALRSHDVRELALVWHKPKSLPPQFSFIVGQRASARPDVMPAETITVGGQEIRMFVVRVRAGDRDPSAPLRSAQDDAFTRTLRRQPVQAVLHPRALPIPALEAARHLLPEMIMASGTLNRRGFILHGDQRGDQKNAIAENWSSRIPLIARSAYVELLSEPWPGTFQVIGLPVRALVEQLEFPFHGELRAAIEPFLPADADLLVDGDQIVARIDAPAVLPPELVLRSIAARLWPTTRPRRLDGLPVSVLVADPNVFEIAQAGSSRWALRLKSGGDALIFAERSGDSVILATDEMLIDRMKIRPEPVEGQFVRSTLRPFDSAALRSGSKRLHFRTYSACRLNDRSPFIVWSIHPQAVVTVSVDRSGSTVAICGRTAQPES